MRDALVRTRTGYIALIRALLRHVDQQLAYSDGVIETVTRPDERVQRPRTVPSVGPATAAAVPV